MNCLDLAFDDIQQHLAYPLLLPRADLLSYPLDAHLVLVVILYHPNNLFHAVDELSLTVRTLQFHFQVVLCLNSNGPVVAG